jgi:hypothetical protein
MKNQDNEICRVCGSCKLEEHSVARLETLFEISPDEWDNHLFWRGFREGKSLPHASLQEVRELIKMVRREKRA